MIRALWSCSTRRRAGGWRAVVKQAAEQHRAAGLQRNDQVTPDFLVHQLVTELTVADMPLRVRAGELRPGG